MIRASTGAAGPRRGAGPSGSAVRPHVGLSLRRSERGSAAVELVILVPALVLVLGLLVAGGRLWFARATVAGAADAAARGASLARTATEGAADGRAEARRALATEGLRCGSTAVSVDTGAFAVPVGAPATITATVVCDVPFADLGLPGMPGTIRVTATGASALDTYRGRS